MKPQHSHGLEVGDIFYGDTRCGCEWIYVKFHPPTFRLTKKCVACEREASVLEQVQAVRERETFSEFANPSLSYELTYGDDRVAYNPDVMYLNYYTPDAAAISAQLTDGTKVCLKKGIDTYVIGDIVYAIPLLGGALLYIQLQNVRTLGRFSDGDTVTLSAVIPAQPEDDSEDNSEPDNSL